MIGTFCKGFSHIMKVCKTSIPKNILLIVNGQISTGVLMRISEEEILFFQQYFNNCSETLWRKSSETVNLYERYGGHVGVITSNRKTWNITTESLGGDPKIILLPDNFIAEYNTFKASNKKAFAQIAEKYYMDDESAYLKYYYCLSNANITFMQWAIKNYAINRVPNALIQYVLIWNEKYSQFANKLSKGTITAYNGTAPIMGMVTELSNICKIKRANDSIMQFNTAQKHILKENLIDLNLQNILSKFGRLSDTKRQNFIRKMSTVEDYDDIFNQMSALCDVHFKWNRDSFLNYITNSDYIKCEIIFDKDDVIIVKSADYETIKRLGKTTNWCISKNKRYWNDYVEYRNGNTQYVIFDFNRDEDDEYSIVGFTTKSGGTITNAHSFTNNDLMGRTEVSLVPFDGLSVNIYSLLEENNVPLSLFTKSASLMIDWNKDNLYDFLDSNCGDDYDVLHDHGNVLVFSVKSSRISGLYSKTLLRNFNTSLFGNQCVFFANFAKDDDTKLLFSVIFPNGNSTEVPSCMYGASLTETNINLDSCLANVGLPYDTIKRVDEPSVRFVDVLSRYDIPALNNFLANENFVEAIKKNKKKTSDSYYYFSDSLFSHKSLTVLEIFYNHNVKLGDIYNAEYINEFICSIVNQCNSLFESLRRIPTAEDYGMLGRRNPNRNRVHFVGFMKALGMILDKEDVSVFERTISNINNYRYRPVFSEYIFEVLLNKIPVENSRVHLGLIKCLISWCSQFNNGMISKILDKFNTKEVIAIADSYGFSVAKH